MPSVRVSPVRVGRGLALTFVVAFGLLSTGGMLYAQKKAGPPNPGDGARVLPFPISRTSPAGIADSSRLGHPQPQPPTGSVLQVLMEQTQWLIHTGEAGDPIEVTWTGRVFSDQPVTWLLTPANPTALPLGLAWQGTGVPDEAAEPGADVPLVWEFALDGNQPVPLKAQGDHTLAAHFPPGPHQFRLLARGALRYCQPDGYYRLNLHQYWIPQP